MPEKLPAPEQLPAHHYQVAFECGCIISGDDRRQWAREQMDLKLCQAHKKPVMAIVRSSRGAEQETEP